MADFKLGQKPVGLAARRAQVLNKSDALINTTPIIDFKSIDPLSCPDRIGIVFDDSGSMAGQTIQDAYAGVEEFLRNCKPVQTAVAIYPMCSTAMPLTADLIMLASKIKSIGGYGGTPLLRTLDALITKEKITRAVVFSDGQPDNPNYDLTASRCREFKIPVDTIYIGDSSSFGTEKAIQFMKNLADATGGVFMHFDPAKMNFRTAFKYLSPAYYAMLSDKAVITDIESGKRT